ncbi:MAG TPA: ATP-binding cassette domain-containing protein [Longimicrobium sp.]
MEPTLLLEGVSKRYSGHTAVDNLSLTVPRGTIYGILGPNGAGKSTTPRMVMNILIRDSGRISLLGADPERDRSVLRRVGFLPEERGLYKNMGVIDVIVFFAQLKGVDAASARREGLAWLDRMSLGDWKSAKVETLSKGMQQKVQFITTVIHKPELLILDEPQSGLDPVNQEVLRDTILQHRKDGNTVIFSTHNMDQAEQLCEHVCIIAQGQKVLDGRLRDIQRENRGKAYRVSFEDDTPAVESFMSAARFGAAERVGDGWLLDASAAEPRALVSALNELDTPLARFERAQPSLHEIFVSRVADAAQTRRRPEAAHV